MRVNRFVRGVDLSYERGINHSAGASSQKTLKMLVQRIGCARTERLAKLVCVGSLLRGVHLAYRRIMQFWSINSLKSNLDLALCGDCFFFEP